MKKLIKKQMSHAFGKDIFLLGADTEGKYMWLEEPTWDCGWYWGFGYIEIYTNSKFPAKAKDIMSHSHFSGLVGKQEYYDHEKGYFRNGEYIHNIYDSPQLIVTTFTEKEGWDLSELFKEFYLLQSMAAYTSRTPAGCYMTTSPVEQDADTMISWNQYINKVMIPKVTEEIMRILSPVEKEG